MKRFFWIAIFVGALGRILPAMADTVLDDFDTVYPNSPAPWTFYNGAEFPGMTGSLTLGPGYNNSHGAHLAFSKTAPTGAYVSATLNLATPQTAWGIGFHIKSPAGIIIWLNVVDNTGQTFSISAIRPVDEQNDQNWEWRTVQLVNSSLAHYWGGANDGVVHQPISSVSIAAQPYAPGLLNGAIDFDDVTILSSPAPVINPMAPIQTSLAGMPPWNGMGVVYHGSDVNNQVLNEIQSLGFKTVRADMTWPVVETTPGVYDFSAYDPLYNAFSTHGIQGADLVMAYGNPLYTVSASAPPLTPQAVDAYTRFAGAVAAHFKGQAVRYELWNEENGYYFWPDVPQASAFSSTAAAHEYAVMASSAMAMIQKIDPNAQVIPGGLSEIDNTYLESLIGAEGFIPPVAVPVHPYRSDCPEQIVDELLVMRSYLKSALPNNTPTVWFNELGDSSANYGDGHSTSARNSQAVYVARQTLTEWIQQIPYTIYYDIMDDGSDSSNVDDNYGLLTTDLSEKPAATAWRTLTQLAKSMTLQGTLPTPYSTLHAVRFGASASSTVALWLDELMPGPIPVSFPVSPVSAIDYLGNPVAVANNTVSVSTAPVYVTFPNPTLSLSSIAAAVYVSSAVITWTTNNATDSYVQFGTSTAYGVTVSSAALLTQHQITLTGLIGNQTYHYRVGGTDISGTVTYSGDQTFATSIGTVVGFLDNGYPFQGWALDTSSITAPISIALYANGPIGQGVWISTISTISPRADLTNYPGNVAGFNNYNLPPSLKDGQTHLVYAYAIDLAGDIVQLWTSPQSGTFPTLSQQVIVASFNGSLDGPSVVGWALDFNHQDTATPIELYLDGPIGAGSLLTATTANQPRPDINTGFAVIGDHGFRYFIPAADRDGNTHQVYAYYIDANGNRQPMGSSPQPYTFQCSFLNCPSLPLGYQDNAISIQPVGTPQIVYDFGQDHCDLNDGNDARARAFRDANGQVNFIDSYYVNTYRSVGSSLNSLTRNCQSAMQSIGNPDFNAATYHEWLNAVYTFNGTDIYGLVANEWYGWLVDPRCTNNLDCWVNSVTLTESHDAGANYAHPSNYIVLHPTTTWSTSFPVDLASGGTIYGMFEPSNIIQKDGYYYFFFASHNAPGPDQSATGACVARTQDITQAASWTVWNGTQWVNPAVSECQAIAWTPFGNMHESVTYNSYLNAYVLDGPHYYPFVGFFMSFSQDLIHWTHAIEFVTGPAGPNSSTLYNLPQGYIEYPSMLDPTDTSRNFEKTGRTPYLYFTNLHDRPTNAGVGGSDVVRQQFQFTIPYTLTLSGTVNGTVPPNGKLTAVVSSASPLPPNLFVVLGSTTIPVPAVGNTQSIPLPLTGLTSGSYSVALQIQEGAAFGPKISVPFAIQTSTPTVAALSPSIITAGDPAFNLAVAGQDFQPGCTTYWNGSALSTYFVNASSATASVPASFFVSVGTVTVQVINPDGGTSNTLSFSIVPPPQIPILNWPASIALDGILTFSPQAGCSYQWIFTPDDGTAHAAVDGSPAQTIKTSAPSLALADQGLAPGRYSVQVIVTNAAGESAAPAQATVTITPIALSSVRVYPNPFRSSRGDTSMTFDQMTTGSTVKIFTVSARDVKTLSAPNGSAAWDLTNDSGEKVASGIYLYIVTDGQGNKTRGKFTVIK